MIDRSVAIMQPYIFPYIGYFHLIQASSVFIFYDDVNYITRGWINRNRIINYDRDLLFTVPVSKASRNKLIKEIVPAIDDKWKNKFYKQMVHSYKKAPFFNDIIETIMSIFTTSHENITELSIASISTTFSYLGINFLHKKSSICSPETRGMEKASRLIEITKQLGCRHYINASGGEKLYSKKYFLDKGVNLLFVKSKPIEYRQHTSTFIPWLSIIDVLMFNKKQHIIDFLSNYTIE